FHQQLPVDLNLKRKIMSLIQSRNGRPDRRGTVLTFFAGFLLPAVILVALVIDIGFVAMTKTQLQAAADSAALAGGMDLIKGLGSAPTLTPSATMSLAQQDAVTFATNNRAGDQASIYCNASRDVRFGNAVFNDASQTWTQSWGVAPYN